MNAPQKTGMSLPLPEVPKASWKMTCSRCKTEVEFPPSSSGQIIRSRPCPCCGLEVDLYFPSERLPEQTAKLAKTDVAQQPSGSRPEALFKAIGLIAFLVFLGGIIGTAYYFLFYTTNLPGSEYVNLERLDTRRDGIIICLAASGVGFFASLIWMFLYAISAAGQNPKDGKS